MSAQALHFVRAKSCQNASLRVRGTRLFGLASTLLASSDLTLTPTSTLTHVQVSDGRVKSVSAASAGDLVSDGWTLLDVRPPHEVQKVRQRSSARHLGGT